MHLGLAWEKKSSVEAHDEDCSRSARYYRAEGILQHQRNEASVIEHAQTNAFQKHLRDDTPF